jgi:Spy/CpxP family protein refolding chaperone
MKGFTAIRVGFAVAGVLIAGSALAQGPGAGMGQGMGPGMSGHRPPIERAFGGEGIRGRWWNNPKVIERLKLTDEQRKAFDGILLQHRETLIDLRANVEKAELAMEPLMHDDTPNEGKILAQIDKVAQARAELEKANARYLLALRSKLTPEQWKQVQEFREKGGMEGRGRDHERMRPGGRGPEGPGSGQQPPPPGPQGMVEDEPGPGAQVAAVGGSEQ